MAEKRMKIGQDKKEFILDDSQAITTFVDIFTEQASVDGMIFLGLGSMEMLMENSPTVKDRVHLRMSPFMAMKVAGALLDLASKAKSDTAQLRERLDAMADKLTKN